jgi:hypothetical protein
MEVIIFQKVEFLVNLKKINTIFPHMFTINFYPESAK